MRRGEEWRNYIDSNTKLIRFPLRRPRQADDTVVGGYG